MLQKARSFFAARNVLEVDCCALVRSAPVDAYIDVINAHATDKEWGYLHTSPEYAMKRLLSSGIGDIYFLGHVFRKGEIGSIHNPEFTMAEWYRLGFTFEEMIQETCEFLFLFFGDLPVRHLSYRDAFATYAGIDYTRITLDQLRQAAKDYSLNLPEDTSSWMRDTFVHLLLTHVVEPHLGRGELTVLLDYPPYEAALACVVEKNGEKVAERCEIYYQGIELSNSYHELRNAEELRERFKRDNVERNSLGKETYTLDEKFLNSVETMPECCGVSVGFDRALMLRNNLKSIRELLSFSWQDS